ncbi:hypothetical protein PAXRUDRAFT_16234 [Paxillus rubicundulus Ve08.2h10]|uniref:Uncharacterized protein n=1 Tax=Paxillus rubicundulus Ve08.2h10 TaxID=930991 RepID=A0A0D0DF62_9AGAM|nr:hypothetical protein PAXRUDRAFT_16234 [Paxillus rubicundulus Ve08.2h10]
MGQIIDNDHNVTTLSNVIVMDIEELHASWKTYHINVTTDIPGDLSLVLCLKAKDTKQPQSNRNSNNNSILVKQPQSISSEDGAHVKQPQSNNSDSESIQVFNADITMVEQPEPIHPRKASLRLHKVIAKLVRLLHLTRSKSCFTKAIKVQSPLKVHTKNKKKDLNVPLIVNPDQFLLPTQMSPLIAYYTPPADN